MVTQKAISAKIDQYTLDNLDKAIRDGHRYDTRNRAINKAIELYTLVYRIESEAEGWSPENQQRLADFAHKLFMRWR